MELAVPITERKKAQAEITSMSKFPLENPYPVLRVSKDGTVLFANVAAKQILEKKSGVGKLAPVEGRGWVSDVIKSGLPKENEIEIDDKIFSFVFTPINGEGYVNIYGIDITERKHAEETLRESEERSRAIIANSPIGIATSGADTQFLSANEAFCKILGYKEEELRKLTFEEITHPEDFKESALKMEELENGKVSSFTLEKRYIKKDGGVVDGKVMVSAVPNKNGKPSLFVAELEDITERKKTEEQRKVLERKVNDYSKHLKCMVDLRTIQLKDANERLIKSERLAAIGELAGMVGHDLRNPLSGIKNATFFLKKKGTAISEAQAKEMLETIDKDIDHSDKIINDLIEYAKEMHLELTKYAAYALVDDATR